MFPPRKPWGRLAAPIFFLLAGGAQAHLRYDVRVEMTPPQLPGVIVELHQDALAPQLVVANHSGKLLEILDANGSAFLRIGGGKAEADVAAATFHQSRISGGASPPVGTISQQPRWRRVNREPNYGWFDPRIAVAHLTIPYAIQAAGQATGNPIPFGEWSIPVRLGGEASQLRGFFVHTPIPKGGVQTVLLTPAELAPGVSVQLAPGPVPAIMLRNTGKDPVSVLDSRGQPFIRIDADGTHADLSSPDWPAASAGNPAQGKGWQRLSKARSLVWLEKRASYQGKNPKDSSATRLGVWSVPLMIGQRRVDLRGAHDWVPAPTKPPKK